MITKTTAINIMDDFIQYFSSNQRPKIYDEIDIGIKMETLWYCVYVYRELLIDSRDERLSLFISLINRIDNEFVVEISPEDRQIIKSLRNNPVDNLDIICKYLNLSRIQNAQYIKQL